jgi:hypothetical protein
VFLLVCLCTAWIDSAFLQGFIENPGSTMRLLQTDRISQAILLVSAPILLGGVVWAVWKVQVWLRARS